MKQTRKLNSPVYNLAGYRIGKYIGQVGKKLLVLQENGWAIVVKEKKCRPYYQSYYVELEDHEFHSLRVLCENNSFISWDSVVKNNDWTYLAILNEKSKCYITAINNINYEGIEVITFDEALRMIYNRWIKEQNE